jgi:hypothetical protein
LNQIRLPNEKTDQWPVLTIQAKRCSCSRWERLKAPAALGAIVIARAGSASSSTFPIEAFGLCGRVKTRRTARARFFHFRRETRKSKHNSRAYFLESIGQFFLENITTLPIKLSQIDRVGMPMFLIGDRSIH